MLVGQRISQIPPYGLQNYIAGILAALERICHCDRHGLFTLSVLILNFVMKPELRPFRSRESKKDREDRVRMAPSGRRRCPRCRVRQALQATADKGTSLPPKKTPDIRIQR